MSVKTLLSEEEFLALPDSPGKQELLDGELIELPPPRDSHDDLGKRIAVLLAAVLGWPRVWIASGYWLAKRRWLIPDVSVAWPDQRKEDDWKRGSPMIVIEIASRGNTPAELEKKRLLYLESGAAEVWYIYPETHTMTVWRKDGTVISVGPIEDYRCDLAGVTLTPEYRTPIL